MNMIIMYLLYYVVCKCMLCQMNYVGEVYYVWYEDKMENKTEINPRH